MVSFSIIFVIKKMKAFRFINDNYIRNTLITCSFNTQVLNYVRHTFHSEEPYEREKIIG